MVERTTGHMHACSLLLAAATVSVPYVMLL